MGRSTGGLSVISTWSLSCKNDENDSACYLLDARISCLTANAASLNGTWSTICLHLRTHSLPHAVCQWCVGGCQYSTIQSHGIFSNQMWHMPQMVLALRQKASPPQFLCIFCAGLFIQVVYECIVAKTPTVSKDAQVLMSFFLGQTPICR